MEDIDSKKHEKKKKNQPHFIENFAKYKNELETLM